MERAADKRQWEFFLGWIEGLAVSLWFTRGPRPFTSLEAAITGVVIVESAMIAFAICLEIAVAVSILV